MKKIIYLSLSLLTLALYSCKKEDMSEYVKMDELPKIENLNLTITPDQWIWNSSSKRWQCSVPHAFLNTSALVGYIQQPGGNETLPYYDAELGVTFGLVDNTSSSQILITYYNGSTSLQSPQSTAYVYLKVIPSGMKKSGIEMMNSSEISIDQ